MSLYTSKVEALQVRRGFRSSTCFLRAAEEARGARLHRLGNLTITTQPLNSAMKNAAWPVKQKQLQKGSKLLLNQWLIDEFPDRVDESSIDQRGEWLADRIVSIWPGPDARDAAK